MEPKVSVMARTLWRYGLSYLAGVADGDGVLTVAMPATGRAQYPGFTVAVYEYRCQVCEARFEARRPMSEAASPIECPAGHTDTARLPSVFASVGAVSPRRAVPTAAAPAGGCGPGCACAH